MKERPEMSSKNHNRGCFFLRDDSSTKEIIKMAAVLAYFTSQSISLRSESSKLLLLTPHNDTVADLEAMLGAPENDYPPTLYDFFLTCIYRKYYLSHNLHPFPTTIRGEQQPAVEQNVDPKRLHDYIEQHPDSTEYISWCHRWMAILSSAHPCTLRLVCLHSCFSSCCFTCALLLTVVSFSSRKLVCNQWIPYIYRFVPFWLEVVKLQNIPWPFLLRTHLFGPGDKKGPPVGLLKLTNFVPLDTSSLFQPPPLPPLLHNQSFHMQVSAIRSFFAHITHVPFHRIPKTLGWPTLNSCLGVAADTSGFSVPAYDTLQYAAQVPT